MTQHTLGLPLPRGGARPALIGIALLALAVAGCVMPPPDASQRADLGDYRAAPRDLIGVTSIGDSHVVRLGRGGSVSKVERDRLDAFIAAIATNRPESLRVSLRGRATTAQLNGVADLLVADGVNPGHIVRGDPRLGPPGAVVVAVERALAVQPNCPGWVDYASAPADNRTSPDFGCANASNFAAMVADPHHLGEPASSIYHDGERGATSVASYRADKVKDLPALNETFAVIPTAH